MYVYYSLIQMIRKHFDDGNTHIEEGLKLSNMELSELYKMIYDKFGVVIDNNKSFKSIAELSEYIENSF